MKRAPSELDLAPPIETEKVDISALATKGPLASTMLRPLNAVRVEFDPAGISKVGETLSGRYRIEEALAEGGMGVVFQAEDLLAGRRVALKQLLPKAGGDPRLVMLFEREYQTLSSLRHPSILRVYEYGVAGCGPFFTMELVKGKDIGELAPTDFRTACRYLRDVASPLALLHARGLLHRDISARNIRVTGDGRCKLLDFGTVAPFGIQPEVLGTPLYISPEALNGESLDHRSDLYCLGVLAYLLLTGRHPYRARSLAGLPDAWKSPLLRPSHYTREIPEPLDELVMSLLSHSPASRPSSAAEVIDRLNALGGLTPEAGEIIAEAYLHAPPLVGRDEELRALHGFVDDLVAHGRGALVVVESRSGMGRTRVLGEACLHAQLSGALALKLDGSLKGGRVPLEQALMTRLSEVALERGREAAAPHAATIGRLVPALTPELSPAAFAKIPDIPNEWRLRVQEAVHETLVRVSEAIPLVVAVDRLEHVDDAFAAFLLTIARESSGRILVLGASCVNGDSERPVGQIALRTSANRSMVLQPLDRDATVAYVSSVFGAVHGVQNLAEWLHGLARGTPLFYASVVRHLISTSVLRYSDGVWEFPLYFDDSNLPGGIEQALVSSLGNLSVDARRVAEALSVTAAPLDLGTSRALARGLEDRAVFRAVDELVEHDVLCRTPEGYRFCQDTLRKSLLASLSAERQKTLHVCAGAALLAQAGEDQRTLIEAGDHFISGGERLRGADLLARAGIRLATTESELASAVPALEKALEVYRAEGLDDDRVLPLLAALASASYYSDYRLAERYGDVALERLKAALGLSVAERLAPKIGGRLALLFGLGAGALRWRLFAKSANGVKYPDLFVMYFNAVATLAGVASTRMDKRGVLQRASDVALLTHLGPHHLATFIHDYIVGTSYMISDRAAHIRRVWDGLLRRFDDPRTFAVVPDGSRAKTRDLYLAGARYVMGIIESWRDDGSVLERAEELERMGLKVYGPMAYYLRFQHHMTRGELAEAALCRQKLELAVMQTGTSWHVEIGIPLVMLSRATWTGDVTGVKRASQTLSRLAETAPQLKPYAAIARGAHLLLRGQAREAAELLESVVLVEEPHSMVIWSFAVACLAAAYTRLGEPAKAKALCERWLQEAEPEDLPYAVLALSVPVQLAMAESAGGATKEAAARLDELIDRHGNRVGPGILCWLHEARAEIALAARDATSFGVHIGEMGRWCKSVQNPFMIARCERLIERASRLACGSPSNAPAATTKKLCLEGQTDRERAAEALRFLLEPLGVETGMLYVMKGTTATCLATSGDVGPTEELDERVSSAVRDFCAEEMDSTVYCAPDTEETDAELTRPRRSPQESLFVVSRIEQGKVDVAGVLVVPVPLGGLPAVPGFASLEMVARELLGSGNNQTSVC